MCLGPQYWFFLSFLLLQICVQCCIYVAAVVEINSIQFKGFWCCYVCYDRHTAYVCQQSVFLIGTEYAFFCSLSQIVCITTSYKINANVEKSTSIYPRSLTVGLIIMAGMAVV